jgi:KaiC/GvpD/RAD55 family RecA-like ATPase
MTPNVVTYEEAQRLQRQERARQQRERQPGEDDRPPRFALRRWGEAREAVQPDRLVHKLLGAESFAVLCGPPGCGKSFLALDIALAIARGVAIFGRAVTCGAVLYVNAEGFGGFSNRLVAYERHHCLAGEEVSFAWIAAAPDLGPGGSDAEHVVAAGVELQQLTGRQVLLVVVDTLARSIGAGDENAGPDMAAFIGTCDRIRREFGAATLIVHHVGKNTERGMRGHSSLLAAADTVVNVERTGEGAARTATVVKQKDGADGEVFAFELRPVEIGTDDHGEAITSCVVVPNDTPTPRGPKLSATERRFLDALHNALADHAERRPGDRNFPGVALVALETWKTYATKSAATAGASSPASERAMFSKARKALMDKKVIAEWDGMVWLCATARN